MLWCAGGNRAPSCRARCVLIRAQRRVTRDAGSWHGAQGRFAFVNFHSDVSWNSNSLSKRLIETSFIITVGRVMQINVCAERRTASRGAVALQRMLCPSKAKRAFLRIRVNAFETSYCAAPKLSPSSRRSAAAVAAHSDTLPLLPVVQGPRGMNESLFRYVSA
jgi:hypothetical protein